jgi:nitrogen fixation protein FixH
MINTGRSWPAAIIAYFLCFILMLIFFVTWAVRQNVEIVRKNYYAEEIQFQRHLDMLNRTARLESPVTISYESGVRRLRLSLPSVHRSQHVVGRIEFYRPSDTRLDKSILFRPSAGGYQDVDTAELANGLWKIRFSWTANGEDYFAEETVVVESRL